MHKKIYRKLLKRDKGIEAMANTAGSIKKIVKKYIKVLEENNIRIIEAVIFGSWARGTAKKESDIDIALVSDAFTGDRFEDRRKIVPLRRKIDSRIEPIPFTPEDFYNSGIMVEEIKRTGKIIMKKKDN